MNASGRNTHKPIIIIDRYIYVAVLKRLEAGLCSG
jgi:hypothetical protein